MAIKRLYRPVGLKEMKLVIDSGMKEFPERLPEQPIFYPVLNKEYASQIAKDWNTKDSKSGYCGFVTSFDVDEEYIKKFDVKVVGSKIHEELWVPADELSKFNSNIIGKIQIIDAYYNLELYNGLESDYGNNAKKQLGNIYNMFINKDYNMDNFVLSEYDSILLNYRYWILLNDFKSEEKKNFLNEMRNVWNKIYPDIRLF